MSEYACAQCLMMDLLYSHIMPSVLEIDCGVTVTLTKINHILKMKDILGLPGPGYCPRVLEAALHPDGQQGPLPATPLLCTRCLLLALLPSGGQNTENNFFF